MSHQWIGRFAPTPSGPLHFGSLVAALGSYLIAKQSGGRWLLRIEDIDPPREVPGAAQEIIKTLDRFGFEWDGEIMFQSERNDAYEKALVYLNNLDKTYRCDCSRKMIEMRNQGIYDRYCLNRNVPAHSDHSIRLKFDADFSAFDDQIQGRCHFVTPEFQQDFIVRRRDGLYAYQLAVVVDDIEQGVNHVVRGADILDSTPRQNLLYHYLKKSAPTYYHLPLVINASGQKFSKSKFYPAIQFESACSWLVAAFKHLGQTLPEDYEFTQPKDFLNWAVKHFKLSKIGRAPRVYQP